MRNVLIAALLLVASSVALAQTTEFTYQGTLKDNGNPANANYDFEFALFDAPSGGSQVGSTIPKNNLLVTNGVFAVKLDFGSVFPGANRYLEIKVRQTGQPTFTTLSRQLINSAPYSVKTLNADNATNAVNATTATNATQLGGVAASQYVVTTDPRMSDARQASGVNFGTTSLSGTLPVNNGGTGSATKNFVDLSTDQTSIGGNKTFTGNLTFNGNLGVGTAPGVTAPGSILDVAGRSRFRQNTGFTGNALTAGFWLYQNNAAADRAFVGMTDDNNVGFTGNGVASSVLLMNTLTGNVGIGQPSPTFPLTFANTLGNKISLWSNGAASYGFGIQSSLLQVHTDISAADIAFGYGSSSAFTENMRIKGNGNVGIGTSSPLGRLHVVTTNDGTGPLNVPAWDSRHFVIGGTGNSGGLGMSYDQTNNLSYIQTLKPNVAFGNLILQYGGGNVGIGTTAPKSVLHLAGNSGSFAMTFTNAANTVGRRGYRLAFDNDRFTFQQTDDNGNFSANQVSIDQATGNVGIGTITPGATLEVNGYTKLGSDSPSIRTKKLTGTTAPAEGGSVSIPLGLDVSKIVSVSVMAMWSNNADYWVGPGYSFGTVGTHFNWFIAGGTITIVNAPGASAAILSKPIKILITYEQ